MIDLLGWFLAGLLVLATVVIHYELIRITSDIVIPWAFKRFHDRRIMVLMMATLLLGHIFEIWVFAVAIMLMNMSPDMGRLTGNFDGTFNTLLYFSAVNYTSMGYGDISPHGCIRSLAVSEALTGLMMIAWSASFTYLKMEQIWQSQRKGHDTLH